MDIFGKEYLGDAGGFVCAGCGCAADPETDRCEECGVGAKPKRIELERFAEEVRPPSLSEGIHQVVHARLPEAQKVLTAPFKTIDKGRVYFIGPANDDGPIKIGFTSGDAEERRRSIQTYHPESLKVIGVIEADFKTEKEIHRRFAESKLRGEWFKRTPELLSFIAGYAR